MFIVRLPCLTLPHMPSRHSGFLRHSLCWIVWYFAIVFIYMFYFCLLLLLLCFMSVIFFISLFYFWWKCLTYAVRYYGFLYYEDFSGYFIWCYVKHYLWTSIGLKRKISNLCVHDFLFLWFEFYHSKEKISSYMCSWSINAS